MMELQEKAQWTSAFPSGEPLRYPFTSPFWAKMVVVKRPLVRRVQEMRHQLSLKLMRKGTLSLLEVSQQTGVPNHTLCRWALEDHGPPAVAAAEGRLPYPKAVKDEALRMMRAGRWAVEQIARRTGLKVVTVKGWAQEHGLAVQNAERMRRLREREVCEVLLSNAVQPDEVAALYGMSRRRARQIAASLGVLSQVPARARTTAPAQYRPKLPVTKLAVP